MKYQFFLTQLDHLQQLLQWLHAQKTLKEKFNTNFEGKNIIVYGGKGIVGGISAIMCAQHGSKCTIVGYDGINNVKKNLKNINLDIMLILYLVTVHQMN